MSVQALILRIPASFWRFGLVGVGGLFVDMAVLYAVMWGLGLAAVSAKVFSFLAAATFTWWMNRQYTFGRSGKSLLHEWASFLATNAFGGAVNFAVYTAMVTLSFPYAWMPALATAVGSVSGLLFNYTASRHIVFKPKTTESDSREDAAPFPKIAYPLTLLVCLAFGGMALGLGMDANWDLRNYHWYNGWAFLHGMLDRDLLVSQTPSFYNPTLDVAYAWVTEYLPARAVGFVLGFLHGLNFLPLFAIAWRLSALADPRRRLFASTAVALAGMLGAGGLSEVGTVFYDNVLSLGMLLSVWLVVSRWDKLACGPGLSGVVWAMAAGFPAGLAFGLKQPMVMFCVGLCAAFLVADMPWLSRLRTGFWFGIGVLLGFALGGGHWAWHLWETYGNPLFPFMNHIFRSPWGLPIDYRDDGFLRNSLTDKLLLIYRFSFNPRWVGEIDFRDFRILALMTLMPLVALARVWRKQAHPLTRPGPTGWLLASAFAVLVVWVLLFSIYRYLVPLEMLAPTLLLATIGLLPVAIKTRQYAAVSLIGIVVLTTVPGDWGRVPWEDHAVPVTVPVITRPEETLVLMSGGEPLSFLIPAFPKAMRFYRISSNFRLSDDPDTGFRRLLRDGIAKHAGPIAWLDIVNINNQNWAEKMLASYGLELDLPSCLPVSSPLNPTAAYTYCSVHKLGPSS
ncbi:MAG: GtrA family protein [Methylococcaceae bacterium]|nr:GtrA family protein [Methylococcaceae bacterium]